MKIEISIMTVLLLAANDLLTRAALQGFEQAAIAAAVEWSSRCVRALRARPFFLDAN